MYMCVRGRSLVKMEPLVSPMTQENTLASALMAFMGGTVSSKQDPVRKPGKSFGKYHAEHIVHRPVANL